MESTWQRDLAVLEAVVTVIEETVGGGLPNVAHIAKITDLSEDDVARALRALDGSFLKLVYVGGGPANWFVETVYPAARQAVGQWPNAENLAKRILQELQEAADREPDEARRGKIKSMAMWLGSAGQDLFINVLASVIAKNTGLG